VQIWGTGADEDEPRKLVGGTFGATCAAFSPNGGLLVVGYQDGTALVWDMLAR
jgi:WD40 repeat protein